PPGRGDVRGIDHLLRVHAGRRHGGRPPPHLLAAHRPSPSASPVTRQTQLFGVEDRLMVRIVSARVLLLARLVLAPGCRDGASPPAASGAAAAPAGAEAVVVRRDIRQAVRLHGTVEAASSLAIVVPRLTGQATGGQSSLVITKLVANGARVEVGDVLVEFDRQAQLDTALEKRAEWRDLQEQVRRLEAEHVEAAVKDETRLKTAENALALARLDVEKNSLLPRIEAEKNLLALEAAEAEVAQVRETNALRRLAEQAERRTLEIRRDRAESALRHAERNAELLSVRSPIAGLVVLRSVW